MANELKDEEAGSGDIQAPVEAVDFQALDLDLDSLPRSNGIGCNISAL